MNSILKGALVFAPTVDIIVVNCFRSFIVETI